MYVPHSLRAFPKSRVVLIHAVRNSLIPICTGLGHALGILMAGSYLIEKVFNIDGIGLLGFNSIVGRDYAVVMGVLGDQHPTHADRQHHFRRALRLGRPAGSVSRKPHVGTRKLEKVPESVLKRRWRKFKTLKRGWYSLDPLLVVTVRFKPDQRLFWVNNRALNREAYQGDWTIPRQSERIPPCGSSSSRPTQEIGEARLPKTEATQFQKAAEEGDWVLMPIYPFHPNRVTFWETLAGNAPPPALRYPLARNRQPR